MGASSTPDNLRQFFFVGRRRREGGGEERSQLYCERERERETECVHTAAVLCRQLKGQHPNRPTHFGGEGKEKERQKKEREERQDLNFKSHNQLSIPG